MKKIKFKYRDEATMISGRPWREQECIVSSVEECIDMYGLETDPTMIEYKIISVEEVNE